MKTREECFPSTLHSSTLYDLEGKNPPKPHYLGFHIPNGLLEKARKSKKKKNDR